ncbi:hypothetical protein OA179_03570 [Candidatus Pelagibacter sp.]|nr:hypothetical protein [Candidatus Pelagibacter sp.]
MFNLSFISKKNFLGFLNKVNFLLIDILNNLKFSNLKRLTRLFLIDKRVIITIIIIFFSVFIHLSTPAFYKDSFVKEIIKNQYDDEFNFKIEFSDELYYSIFPIPHFNFIDAKLIVEEKEIAEIKSLKVYLTFSKFFHKNKMNIQKIFVKDAKFNLYKEDIKSSINFFNKKINEKKIVISNSKIFLKNEKDDIYSIISLNKSKSFYDSLELINKLDVNGEIFNNSFKFNLRNNFFEKKSEFDLVLNKLNKKFINKFNFSNETKVGIINYLDKGKKYDTNYTFDKETLKFNSEEKINDKPIYSGLINFSPFSSSLQVYRKNINLSKLFSNDSFLIEIMKSNIFANENLNFNINLKSKNVSDHRKLKDLELKINYENGILNFDQSNLLFEDILSIQLVNSEFKNTKNKQYITGNFKIFVKDHQNLFSFFQTKKQFRKKINEINFIVKYDFLRNKLSFEKLSIDNMSNEGTQYVMNLFNQENRVIKNRVDLRNFFNSVVEEL